MHTLGPLGLVQGPNWHVRSAYRGALHPRIPAPSGRSPAILPAILTDVRRPV